MRYQNDSKIDEISGKGLDDHVFLRLQPYLRPHLFILSIYVALVFASAGIALYTPKLLGRMVDQALLPKNSTLLYQLCLLYGGLELLRLICIFTQNFGLQKIGQSVMQSLRNDLFSRIIRMPVTFFDKNPTGRLVTRLTNDTVNLSELFSSGFVMLLSDVLLIGGVIAVLITMHWKLALLSISVFPIMLATMYVFSGKLRVAFRRSREVLARLNGFYAERMAGMPVVQLMQKEEYEKNSFSALSEEYRERQFDGVYLYSLFHPTITLLTAVSIVLVILKGPTYFHLGELPLGAFVSFLAYVQVLYQPVRNITDRYNVFLAAMSSAERIFTLMDMSEEEGLQEIRPSASELAKLKISGNIRFENITFAYETAKPGDPPALKNVSFEIKEGETVAIVGHTGAGKTTTTSLLFRFYDPQSGKIFLGNKELREFKKPHLRERIGYVQQDVFLFSGTVRENLTLLRQGIEDEEILRACRHTGFHKILEKLPEGLNTPLDERGSNLSLGERQILAFTRVYLQQPDILVLDEATSSVDPISEFRIQEAAKELVRERTSLIIAHRLETVLHADRILVFEKGELKEIGNHETLMQKEGGLYSKFVKLQMNQDSIQNEN